jgi:ABC-type lipoprotein release transport system permease subunit
VDPITYTAVIVVLGSIAALATWIPARRATIVDPALALRGE